MSERRRFYAVFATDKPGMREVRDQIRPLHRTYLREMTTHGVFVRPGAPTLEPRYEAPRLAAITR